MFSNKLDLNMFEGTFSFARVYEIISTAFDFPYDDIPFEMQI